MVLERGLIDCFTPLLANEKGQLLNCEASAAVAIEGALLLAIDKKVPGTGRSSIFSLDRNGLALEAWTNRHLTHPAILDAVKFEGMTVSPDGGWIIATTAFDRIKKKKTKQDGYNMLLAWPVEKKWKTEARVLAASTRKKVTSSRKLRGAFSALLDDLPYFKIEGLRVSTKFDADGPMLVGDVKTAYEPPEPLESVVGPGSPDLGLSSIEYDPYNDRLYLLTSYEVDETAEGLGGYLWTLPMADFHAKRMPTLMRKEDGTPLRFAHKPEGLAVIGASHVIAIHDDDRVRGRKPVEDPETQFYRLPHQAAYTVVRVD